MNSRTRIKEGMFAPFVHKMAAAYGIKSVGGLIKFLDKCKPALKITVRNDAMRVAMIRKHVARTVAKSER